MALPKHAAIFFNTKIGRLKISCTQNSIIELRLVRGEEVSEAETNELCQKAIEQIQEYLQGMRKRFDLPIELRGSEFQKKVWRAVLGIPYGQTMSYKEVAHRIGHSRAARAVGLGAHKNPLLLLVPCHRVIATDGSLTGYAAGVENKKLLLELEQAQVDLE